MKLVSCDVPSVHQMSKSSDSIDTDAANGFLAYKNASCERPKRAMREAATLARKRWAYLVNTAIDGRVRIIVIAGIVRAGASVQCR